MLLSVRDFDLLRLLRWCRCVYPSDLKTIFSETEILNLMGAGLVKLHSGSASLILTGKGQKLIDEEYGNDIPNMAPSYRDTDIARRVRTAKLILTAYRAGLSVFTMGMEALAAGFAIFLPSLARARGRNLWGNSRIAAVGHIGDLICGFHHVGPDAGRVILADELRAFTANTSGLEGHPATVLCGDSYETLLAELETTDRDTGGRLVRYGEAYRRMPFPTHLLSSDETGAMQLQIMAEPDYQSRLTRAALRGQYRAPPDGLDCDATFDGVPFYMAADMNLRRLDAAVETARDLGYSQIAMVALKEQVESLLGTRYKNNARIFTLTQSALTELFGHPPALYMPPEDAYRTKKGDVLHAPLIRADRKALEACGEK